MHPNVVTITSLAPTGHGIAENGWYILGAYPNDVVKAQVYREAESIIYAEIIDIVESSQYRTHTPTEKPFFDANAPWAYLDAEYENLIKQEIVHGIFQKTTDAEITSNIIAPGSQSIHYRNKVAYSFMLDKQNKLTFALYSRGVSGVTKTIQTENLLVHETLNKIGKQFLHFFNQKNVDLKTLKYLTLRYSYHTDTVVAQILVTETSRRKLPWKKSDLEKLVNQHPKLQGIIVSHSEPGIRSATISKDFYVAGDIHITEEVLDKQYTYHPSQFFQIYPDGFAQILNDCEEVISNISNHSNYELLDFFAGIGIIGLHLAHLVQSVHGVEQSPLAGKYARKNARNNDIKNFSFTETNVDEALNHIKQKQILVVDPARSGLTKKYLEKITEVQPEYIIYISCNPETQAQDYYELKDHYNIEWSRAYNLFPKTPHIEHVIFLTKKATV